MTKISTLDGFAGQALMQSGQQENLVNKAKSLSNNDIKTKDGLEKAAKGFEALLLHQMLKEMWNTVETGGLMGEDSNQAQIYRDMLNQAISDSVSDGRGIGVKDFLKTQLSSKLLDNDESNAAQNPFAEAGDEISED
jgi:Rod binding domain-containing protein